MKLQDFTLNTGLDHLLHDRICSILEQSGVVYALDLDVPEETVSFTDEIDFE